jgi:hypothetical protein
MEVLAAPEQATDEAMFRAFGLPSSSDKDEDNEGEDAGEVEEDEGQHQDGPIYRFLFLVNFYSQLD